jgi:hypothetical protein
MSSIHLIGGEKGGVGKSVVARLLAQYHIDRGLPFRGFDSDRSHGALLRFYAGFASPVVVDRPESFDAIAEAAAEVPDRRVLVDLAAQTQAALIRWIDESDFLDLAQELGIEVRYWHVMDSGRDSVDLLRGLLDRFQGRLAYVLVLNQLRGEDFTILDQSGEKERALGLGARVLTLRKLQDEAMRKIDARSASFWAAATGSIREPGGLGLLERQRVRSWLKHAYAQLDEAGLAAPGPRSIVPDEQPASSFE